MFSGYLLEEVNLYARNSALPTTAPGQYGYLDSFDGFGVSRPILSPCCWWIRTVECAPGWVRLPGLPVRRPLGNLNVERATLRFFIQLAVALVSRFDHTPKWLELSGETTSWEGEVLQA
jgi:hypothetical protein